jgi:hypothetical protein
MPVNGALTSVPGYWEYLPSSTPFRMSQYQWECWDDEGAGIYEGKTDTTVKRKWCNGTFFGALQQCPCVIQADALACFGGDAVCTLTHNDSGMYSTLCDLPPQAWLVTITTTTEDIFLNWSMTVPYVGTCADKDRWFLTMTNGIQIEFYRDTDTTFLLWVIQDTDPWYGVATYTIDESDISCTTSWTVDPSRCSGTLCGGQIASIWLTPLGFAEPQTRCVMYCIANVSGGFSGGVVFTNANVYAPAYYTFATPISETSTVQFVADEANNTLTDELGDTLMLEPSQMLEITDGTYLNTEAGDYLSGG